MDRDEATSHAMDRDEATSHAMDRDEATSHAMDRDQATSHTMDRDEAAPQAMDRDEATPHSSYAHHSSSWTPVDSMTPISTNPSRKRSREDDTSHDPEPDGSYFPSAAEQVKTPAPMPEEPMYGEGMMLLNPQTRLSISAESQSGTWLEEKEDRDRLEQEIKAATFRPKLPTSRKSIRLSQNAINTAPAPALVDTSPFGGAPASPPKSAAIHPEPDDAAVALGISWTHIGTDESIQGAARGWARYIDNHYARHIHRAEIVLKNTAHDAYLVRCHQGFFLFSDDLLEGQLVATTWPRCLDNLKAHPFVFDGDERLRAERTPGPDVKPGPSDPPVQQSTHQTNNWADNSTVSNPAPNWADHNTASNTTANWADHNTASNTTANWADHNTASNTDASVTVDNPADVAPVAPVAANGHMDID
ncbi:hypothetical protein DV737_g2880, partial [Chaetothyriales sp. CBS 132003]